MADLSDIYQLIVEQGTPCKLPGPWAGNKCHADFFDLLLKPAELLKRLRKKSTVEDLMRAGVVTVGVKNRVRLSPHLAENLRYILALRRAAGEKPHDLIAGSSSLRNRTLSSLLKDCRIKGMLESTARQLVVVTTPEDLAVLISFGIPAVPAGGLDFNELHGRRLKRFCKLLRLREWGWGSGSAEREAAAQSLTESAVDESPGTAGSPATAEPQATGDDREDEFAEAAGAEDRADDPEDEFAEAERGEDSTDDLEDEFAETDERKDYARELEDEFYEEADSPETGEEEDAAADFEAQQREWAEANARMEESLKDNSIALTLPNWSPSRLELGDVPQILEIRDQLRVVEEYTELAMDFFGVWSSNPAFLKRLRFAVEQRDPSRIADILRAGLDKDCRPLHSSAAGPRPVPASYPEALGAWMASADSDFDLYRSENWKAVQEWLQKDFIDPLTKEAEETPDALRRNQLVVAAGLNSLVHTQLLSLMTAAAAPGGSHGPAGPRGLPEEEMKQLLRLVDRLRNVTKDIQSWKPQNKYTLAALAAWKKNEPSAPNSESVPATSTKTTRC
jgi:hypothetical protein